uniref:Uncharacterized protein n=1 Tax=Arundo donax TaxID=35708 RepID=A0A0A8ZER4_ARUDO
MKLNFAPTPLSQLNGVNSVIKRHLCPCRFAPTFSM